MKIEIDDLCVSKNAQFYKLKKTLSVKALKTLFKEVSQNRSGSYLCNKVRSNYTSNNDVAVKYSLLSYKTVAEPSFLKGTQIKEYKVAYLLLVELDDAVAVIKKHVEPFANFFDDFLEEFDYDNFCHFYGDKSPEYEKIAMKNMSISNAVIRSRSLEAKNLDGIMSSNSSSRSVPTSFRMKIAQDVYTLTPNTSRVSHRDKKAGFDELVDWLSLTKEEIKIVNGKSEFLNNFAVPVCLEDILKIPHSITAIFLDLGEVERKIECGEAKLKKQNGDYLNQSEVYRFFDILKSPLRINSESIFVKGKKVKGKIQCSKSSIAIKNTILNDLVIEEDGVFEYKLSKLVNEEKPFSAVFDSPNYSYYSRSCFEDKSLLNNIDSMLTIFDDTFDFSKVRSEKEKKHEASLARFPEKSLFRAIEDEYCAESNVVFCDDMNDEWADHISFNINRSVPEVSFVHSKFVVKDTYGASAFHEVVAQALKNIGRTQSDKKSFKEKYDKKWSKMYESTQIPRTIGANNWKDIEDVIDVVQKNPNSIKKVVLATPFLSKSKLSDEIDQLNTGGRCKPHYVQLIWLINTFISSCKEYGAQAYILCKK
ncbi:hypothetical protein [Kushneria konosiri]|uniref:hypothetical protein n=1 Tax=Kushneria konosiri TaxID=698828 RepID=UPI001D130819|nr:hypothetical protein [Kushneria konosiri]